MWLKQIDDHGHLVDSVFFHGFLDPENKAKHGLVLPRSQWAHVWIDKGLGYFPGRNEVVQRWKHPDGMATFMLLEIVHCDHLDGGPVFDMMKHAERRRHGERHDLEVP